MNIHLTQFHDAECCTWCERTKECVTTDFGEGFLRGVPLCFNCLQKAIRVQERETGKKKNSPPGPDTS